MPPGYFDSLGDEGFSNSQIKYYLAEIEDLVDDFHAGRKVNYEAIPIWVWDSFKFWIRTERDYDRRTQLKISLLVDAFSKKK